MNIHKQYIYIVRYQFSGVDTEKKGNIIGSAEEVQIMSMKNANRVQSN